MHACGHDVHITALVGTAHQLAALKDRWRGTVVLDRPAGRGTGRRRQGDARRRPLHPLPQARLRARLPRQFGHAHRHRERRRRADVQLGRQRRHHHPRRRSARRGARIPARTRSISAPRSSPRLQSIVSREIGPLSPAVVTVGSFHAGTKHNIISDRADLQLTVRANDEATRKQLLAAIERIAKGDRPSPRSRREPAAGGQGLGGHSDDQQHARPRPAAPTRPGAGPAGGDGRARSPRRAWAPRTSPISSSPSLECPASISRSAERRRRRSTSARAGGPPVPSHHSPLFRIDPEPSIRLGTEAMTVAVLDLLKPGATASGH